MAMVVEFRVYHMDDFLVGFTKHGPDELMFESTDDIFDARNGCHQHGV
jgi:hypothetical protein